MSVTREGRQDIMPPGTDHLPSRQHDPALDLLRPLARQAVGMSGADVERLVREARGRARRAGRDLTWQDIEELLSAGRPKLSDDLRWQLAVHECGHVLVHLALGRRGAVEIITLEDRGGGFVRFSGNDDVVLSERQAMEDLATLLAGRRAEIVFFGEALSGSGGAPDSDLARATALAISLETSLGFGRAQPLIFRPVSDPSSQLSYDRDLADRVYARLEEADAIARIIIEDHTAALTELAMEVARQRTLEGRELSKVLDRFRQRLQGWSP
ncbi:ATP-dependent Zn protease [Chelativorans sp. ZYF759]|uniref:ATP-dependent Zn protease n=1 Tax=Chelativorans sp. ZYF759 TaxID=2692213 RepID=UPI00145D6F25|nr:ATP-dependent Zn protease [Chelativorans sp. ZYF759]NMG37871.1 ATP-dependent Zn protease [Chelativorans sp. ZYF759]